MYTSKLHLYQQSDAVAGVPGVPAWWGPCHESRYYLPHFSYGEAVVLKLEDLKLEPAWLAKPFLVLATCLIQQIGDKASAASRDSREVARA